MSKRVQARVISVDFLSQDTDEIEGIIWSESEPSGLLNEVSKRQIVVYYPPDKFPARGFIRKLMSLPQVSSVKSSVVYQKDWNTRWQKSVKPVRISAGFIVVPPFRKYLKPDRRIKRIIINPAMAFGTGHHESTQGIMKLIYRHRERIKGKKTADFGSGSGILSIFARILGAGIVDAFDFDPECKRAISENMRLNKVSGINFFNKSIRCSRKSYDVIFANMLFGEIASNRDVIIRSLRKNGLVFFAGILDCEREKFINLFGRLKLADELLLNDWRSFLFEKI
ncbi:MAG: 50S ribosomal protein L11 methyltransferase [Deltaproteobacteria bacterium]|nr:50S ribosomal protein L11 methyltransferase [Deltaproteobacteria bacterium]